MVGVIDEGVAGARLKVWRTTFGVVTPATTESPRPAPPQFRQLHKAIAGTPCPNFSSPAGYRADFCSMFHRMHGADINMGITRGPRVGLNSQPGAPRSDLRQVDTTSVSDERLGMAGATIC